MVSGSFESNHLHLDRCIQIHVFITKQKKIKEKVFTDMPQIKLYASLYITGGFIN